MVHQSIEAAAEDAVDQTASKQYVFQMRMAVRAALASVPDLENVEQNEEIENTDRPQE